MIISTNTEKSLDKFSIIHDRKFQQTQSKRDFLNLIKDIYKNLHTANVMLNDGILNL